MNVLGHDHIRKEMERTANTSLVQCGEEPEWAALAGEERLTAKGGKRYVVRAPVNVPTLAMEPWFVHITDDSTESAAGQDMRRASTWLLRFAAQTTAPKQEETCFSAEDWPHSSAQTTAPGLKQFPRRPLIAFPEFRGETCFDGVLRYTIIVILYKLAALPGREPVLSQVRASLSPSRNRRCRLPCTWPTNC